MGRLFSYISIQYEFNRRDSEAQPARREMISSPSVDTQKPGFVNLKNTMISY